MGELTNAIAIVGVAGRFPSARTPAELWRMLAGGLEATEWPDDEQLREAGVADSELADPNYVKATLALPDMEMFDADFFGFSKKDAAVLDPQHRHFLECCWEALEDAGHVPERFDGAVGVFGGCGMQAYFANNLLTNPQLVKAMGLFLLRHTGNDKDFLCTRVSYLLNLTGPSVSVQTACSTSLVAVHVAAQSLLAGECDMALAGGVSIELPHRQGYKYAEGEILSPDGHCRAFDDSAAGTLFGSGAAVVVLRRLEDALQDGDNIYAVIRGSAINNDGYGKAGYLAPSVDGQARAAAEALAVAGVDPRTVNYIEAHGTGTPVGDPIEVAALAQAYGGAAAGSCGIGSIKTNIGHLDTAAGAASLIKVALAMRHGLIPASLNFSRANTRMTIEKTPFQVVAQARPWPKSSTPRRAAVNSLGVGGTNAHVIVEESPAEVTTSTSAATPQVFTLSARTPSSLEALKAKWVGFLADPPPGFSFADAAYTLQVGRREFEHRCAVVAQDVEQLRTVLQAKAHVRSVTSKAAGNDAPKVVFMFPGGGAHYAGAGRELLSQPMFAQAVDECFAHLPADAPSDLRAAMFERDANDTTLQRPRYAIPALFVLEYAVAKLWQSWGIVPAAVIGHSAGEYVAACIAGALPLPDALAIVTLRGQLFETVPSGAMLSIDLSEADLRTAIGDLPLDIAAINAPDLAIASGSVDAIAQLEAKLGSRGLEPRRLHINVAAHSRLLDGVLATFHERLSNMHFDSPAVPFISNLTGRWVERLDADYWTRHLREPVRFADGLALVRDMPDAILLEAGPGQGLSALARQNQLGAQRMILASTCRAQEQNNSDLAQMLASAGALWTRGAPVAWDALRGAGPRRRVPLPTYAFDHQRYWIEPGIRTVEDAKPAPVAAKRPLVDRLPSVDDWFRVPQWVPSAPAKPSAPADEHWLVFGNRSQLTSDVVAQAIAAGGSVTLVRRGDEHAKLADGTFTIAPAQPEHYTRLLRTLEAEGRVPDRIVHLWALDTLPGAGNGRVGEQTLAFDSLVQFTRALQDLDITHPMHLAIVTAGAFAVQGGPVPHPERALALGPCRVIPRELPQVTTCLIDFAQPELSSAAPLIAREASQATGPDLVAYRHGERFAQELAPAPATASPSPVVRERGVYLITGGFGDIALDLAAWLAEEKKARLALVSRRALPPRASWPALAASGDHSAEVRLVRRLVALEAHGAQVLALQGDVADRRAMTRVIGECRARFGTINGVFHAAGVLDDAPIATKTPESIARVIGAKATGAQVLHELLPPGDLDVFCVFSSTSVLLGGAGQVDYVAANAFIDALAASREDGLAIRWGIWGDRGMAARAYGHLLPGDAPSSAHPLLGAQVASDEGAAFEAVYDPNKLWVLREHRVAGRAVLPGTAYIEIARAAMMALHPRAAVEIRSLSFEEAMAFQPGEVRVVRTELRRSGAAYDFTVRSRAPSDGEWLEHARASASVFLGELASAPAAGATGWQPGVIPQEKAVDFGERWRNLARMQIGNGRAFAQLELAPKFHLDTQTFGAHPALTDMAATFGLHLLDANKRAGQLFVPLSIDRIRIAAPLPARVHSAVKLTSSAGDRLASFDVTLASENEKPLARFEGFSLRPVQPDAVGAHVTAPREASLTDAMLACGIRGEDAPVLFERIFRGGARDLVVSSIDVARLAKAMTQAASKPATRAKPATAHAPASLNPVENMLADVWRELLGVDEIAPDDDFFALGGHSLAAVRLFARIRKQYDVDLPLATLFQAPTLGALAALVAQHANIQVAEEAPRKSNVIPLVTRTWSPLVAICKGTAERRPLFCVHGAGGNVLNFKIISDRLGAEQPFYGLQAQGVDGRQAPLTSIEDMASQYLDAIRTVDAHGPYQLAGYSAGGVIAIEIAQRLRREGAQVSLLAMIDTLEPVAARRALRPWEKLWAMRHWSWQFLLDRANRRRRGREGDAMYQQALERLARGEPLPPELVEHHLFRNFVDAQSRYTPPVYEGDVVLFKAMQAETQYLAAGRTLGWDAYVRGKIRVVDIAGSHFSMMSEPGVSQLVEGLRVGLGLPPPAQGRDILQSVPCASSLPV